MTFTLKITYAGKRFPFLPITLDKEPRVDLSKDAPMTFDIEPGDHTIMLNLGTMGEIFFTATGDHEFVIKDGGLFTSKMRYEQIS